MYGSSALLDLNDDAGGVWETAPSEIGCAAGPASFSRFFYRFADAHGPHSLTITASSAGTVVGAFAIEYAGVASPPVA